MVREPDNCAANDLTRRRFSAGACIEPVVDSIRKMRAQGLADNEIAALFRHAADELDDGEVDTDS
jgi:hypothetical protein